MKGLSWEWCDLVDNLQKSLWQCGGGWGALWELEVAEGRPVRRLLSPTGERRPSLRPGQQQWGGEKYLVWDTI